MSQDLEQKIQNLSNMLNTVAISVNELVQKNAEMGMHVAAMLRTVQDSKPLTTQNLSESSILNMVDKMDSYINIALQRGLLKSSDVVTENSVVAVTQLDSQSKEVVRKMLINVFEQNDSVKQSFVGAQVSQIVSNVLENGEPVKFVILQIFEPTEEVNQSL